MSDESGTPRPATRPSDPASDDGGRRSGWAAALLAAACGLGLLGASTAAWSVARVERDVGGVVVPEQVGTSGVEVEPVLLLAGLVMLVAAVPLAVTQGAARRLIAAVLLGAGALGAVATGRAAVRAADLAGGLQPVVGVALLASLGAVAAGALGLRAGPAARLPTRYDTPARGAGSPSSGTPRGDGGELDEWALAAEDDDDA